MEENSSVVEEQTSCISGLSKNALKRQRRQEAILAKKKAKKEKEREAKRERRKENASEIKISDGSTVSPSNQNEQKTQSVVTLEERQQRKRQMQENYLKLCDNNFSVIIDCRWEDKHKERPLRSLKQQISFCYGSSRKAPNPVHIYVTSVGPLLRASLEKSSKNNWIGFHATEKDYTEMDQFLYDPPGSDKGSTLSNATESNDSSTIPKKKKLVYLTSDATETIETLSEDCAYVIGGIVDRNSMKGISYATACKQGIRTVKLPLKEHYSMSATHVLTVNHVFDILLNYHRLKDWKEAIELVLPSRKNAVALDVEENSCEDEVSNAET